MDELRLALVLNARVPGHRRVLVRARRDREVDDGAPRLAAVLPDCGRGGGLPVLVRPPDPDPDCPDGPHEAGPPGAFRWSVPGSADPPARLVELPVGASEDRLLGALDIERALTEGVRAYEPGLLAAAHRGVPVRGRVNLLHDHLVTCSRRRGAGHQLVERDGVSVRHAARFLLVAP